MKMKVTKLSALIAAVILSGCNDSDNDDSSKFQQPQLTTGSLTVIEKDGYQFKDHNKDGEVNPFEDWRLSASERADDLVARMTTEEKAGAMMHGTFSISAGTLGESESRLVFEGGTPMFPNNTVLIKDRFLNTFITRQAGAVQDIADDNNRAQEIAEQTRLAIPLSISSDPRNHFNEAGGASIGAGEFSKWTETLGMAAVDDVEMVKEFADIIRQEYLAVGINQALHPTADIATEPRWGRNNSTFGEDAHVSRRMTKAYVQGLQNSDTDLVKGGVWGVVKHFAGGGPQENGLDAHYFVGRKQVYPGNNFEYHKIPFKGAFEAGVAGVMPYYGMPIDVKDGKGVAIDEVGFNFNKYLLTDVLRGEEKFDGVILSDWLVAGDCKADGPCRKGLQTLEDSTMNPFAYLAMPWGVEDLEAAERAALFVDAGVDSFGGIDDPSALLASIESGRLSIERINMSVKRIMLNKFKQGLFESPMVDSAAAKAIVGKAEFQAAADDSQRRSVTLLKNEGDVLPLAVKELGKVYVSGIEADFAAGYGLTVVDEMADADTIIIRTHTPGLQAFAWNPFAVIMPMGELGFMSDAQFAAQAGTVDGLRDYELAKDSMNDAQLCYPDSETYPEEHPLAGKAVGRCEYTGGATYDLIKAAIDSGKRVILDVFMIRPTALGNIADDIAVITANYGTSDQAFLDVITNKNGAEPQGKLPFGLPFNTAVVEEFGLEDVPSFAEPEKDTITQYEFGFGLSYK
ncbi:glycoside hydrolase family 3 protein [Psychromonas aquimarina]|uniref:glycoside hydrolase family 3 protein n=1 Tax=Psychromonas aquimarina TaxID=444919 RepID=UPI000409222F|nr:glycoside hydrolase family 3 N-terminal domain-containing protein [Psychromonas aquimarina]